MSSDVTRRCVLGAACTTFGAAAIQQVLAPFAALKEGFSIDEFLQQHYKELSREDMDAVLQRLEHNTQVEYGREVQIEDVRPIPGVQFRYGLNLSLCIGCRKCAEACHKENNHDRATNNSYIRVLELDKGGNDLHKSSVTYNHKVPSRGKFYMPIQCHQCDNPPCVKACLANATWKEADGIVVIDYNWCIGCRYCISACPYQARSFNWTKPEIPAEEINPDQSYLTNRIRPVGVVEKCTFCAHRTRVGRFPACLGIHLSRGRVFK